MSWPVPSQPLSCPARAVMCSCACSSASTLCSLLHKHSSGFWQAEEDPANTEAKWQELRNGDIYPRERGEKAKHRDPEPKLKWVFQAFLGLLKLYHSFLLHRAVGAEALCCFLNKEIVGR